MKAAEGFTRAANRADGWINAIIGFGGARDKLTATTVAPISVLHDRDIRALFTNNDLVERAVCEIVRDALRGDPEPTGDQAEEARKALDAADAFRTLFDAAWRGRLWGTCAIHVGVRNTGLASEPLDLESVAPGSLLYLQLVDRPRIQIERRYTNPAEPKYNEPEIYKISSRDGGSALVHESRLIFLDGDLTEEEVKEQAGHGFCLSVLNRPHEVLRDFGVSWHGLMLIVQDMSTAVYKIKGLASMISQGHAQTLQDRMEIVHMSKSAARAVIVDADHEDFEFKGAANIGGLAPVGYLLMQRVASALGMPVTKLFRMSPAGMNATGESDIRLWYDSVDDYRTDRLEPALLRLAAIVYRSAGLAIDEIAFEWPSLWQESPREKAEREKLEADRDAVRISSGVLYEEEVTIAEYGSDPRYADVIDFEARKASLEGVEDPGPSPVPAPTPEPGPGDDPALRGKVEAAAAAAGEALNGTQVKELSNLLKEVAARALPRDSVLALIEASFPISRAVAENIMGAVGITFFSTEPAPSAPVPGDGA